MSHHATAVAQKPMTLDYSLTGVNARLAIEKGLAEADWYQCPVPRATMRKLLERRDAPAVWNTLLWFSLIGFSGWLTCILWGSGWAILPYFMYSTLYASSSDSRWHETGHGTAFKTDWLNSALYEVASFMVMRESTIWRWSHTRHHSDTIIVGRDPEIAVPRPADWVAILLAFFNLKNYQKYFGHSVRHAFGSVTAEERTFIPPSEFPKVFLRARICVANYLAVTLLSIQLHSILPLMLVGFTNLFGTWLLVVYGLTQHAGLAENVLDHRLNCRTVYMNPVNRFLYCNMNYHVEHHMYPLVPFHALPKLHQAVKDDCPAPYPSLFAAWREIIPAVWKQVKDPGYHIKRVLPQARVITPEGVFSSTAQPDSDGWLPVCRGSHLLTSDVIRFDYGKRTFALYRDGQGQLYATDGICTHGNVHLAQGLVKGGIIECSKHNGRFNLIDGSPARAPVCRGLATYPIHEEAGAIKLNISHPGGAGVREQTTSQFRVVSNRNVATFIKELVLEPVDPAQKISFTPGDYMQLSIPVYEKIRFKDFDVQEPYASVWRNQHVFDLESENLQAGRFNNYSLASNQANEHTLRFNVRIATPPPGQACTPGVGSSYVFHLKPGDRVSGIGPFGDFHIKPTQREMVYVGKGAGMAPLRAHLSSLLETENTARKISFWYGARSKQEIFYAEYFRDLETSHPNFEFHLVLSAPLPEDAWTGHEGPVHEAVLDKYLAIHPNPRAVEFYLCGPPMMIKASTRMLTTLGVSQNQIAYDEF